MALFKRSAARGVAHELMRRNVVQFPSKQAADDAADAVADSMPDVPEVSPESGHAPDDIAAIANQLMEIAQQLMAQAGGAPGGVPGGDAGGPPGLPPPDVAKAASELCKIAAASDYESVAHKAALECMDKAAAETKAASALIEGGDKGNKPDQAAQTNEVAALDQKQRPQGTYVTGVGQTDLDTNKGNIGAMSKNPAAPHESPSGTNSVNEGSKAASLSDHLKKLATQLIQGGDKGNTPQQAAQTSEVAELDQKQRPQGKYHVGQGNTNFSEPQAARIGLEKKPDVTPSRTVSGTNSVIEASKAAEEEKAAEEAAFVMLFKKCAADVGPSLPTELTDDERIAAISNMIGFDHDGRQKYLDDVYAKVAEKKAGDVSAMVAAAKNPDEAKQQEDANHRKDGEKAKHAGESTLLDTIKKIAADSKQSAATK